MAGIDETIEVDAPPEAAYAVWADFPGYVRFVKGVKRLERDGDTLHWVAGVGPQSTEWDARITVEEPGRRLAWEAPEGPIDTDIRFDGLEGGRTRVVFTEHMHDSAAATLAAASPFGARRAREDLERFKALVEGRDPDPLDNT